MRDEIKVGRRFVPNAAGVKAMSESCIMVSKPLSSGRISADQILTLEAVQHELGLGRHALREARRKGLKVRRIGRRGYVIGADLIDFIRENSAVE